MIGFVCGRVCEGLVDSLRTPYTHPLRIHPHTNPQTKQLDGVPFGSLPTKPVTLPPRPAVRVSGGSRASLSDSQRRRSGDGGGSGIGGSASLLGDDGHDDFDPRGTGNGKPRAVGMRPSAGGAGGNDNTVDLLGGPPSTDGFAVAAAPPAVPTGGFAPFSAGAATAGGGGGGFPVAFGGPPAAAVVDTKRLADEFGGLALATPAVPTVSSPLVAQKAPGAGGGGNGYYGGGPTKVPLPDMSTFKQPENAGLPSPGEDGAITTTSTALIAVGDAQTPPDVARLTAAIVNLNNLERESDGTKSPPRGNIYRSVYADHRSLAEMQASQAGKVRALCKGVVRCGGAVSVEYRRIAPPIVCIG